MQGKDELMMHEDAVLALAWSKDSEMLATADQVTRPPPTRSIYSHRRPGKAAAAAIHD